MELTPGAEDYLKAVFEVAKEKPVVRIKDIAQKMDVKSSSVANGMKYLAERDLIIHEKYGYIQLTNEGKKLGKNLKNRNRVLTSFLQKTLLLDDETANEDACNIEHYLNPITADRIVKFLEFINLSDETEPRWLRKFAHYVETGEFDCDCNEENQ